MTVAFVQKSAQLFADNASSIAPSLAGVTAGNLVVMVVGASEVLTPVALTAPSGWSTAENPAGTGGTPYLPEVAIFYKENSAGGTESGTVSLPAGSYAQATIIEFSGVATSSSLDVHTSAQGTTTTSGNTGTTGSTTVADSVVVVVGHAEDGVGNTASFSTPASSGYTVIDTSSNNGTHIACDFSYKILAATGTQTGSWTWTGSSSYNNAIAVFKGTGGGGGDTLFGQACF